MTGANGLYDIRFLGSKPRAAKDSLNLAIDPKIYHWKTFGGLVASSEKRTYIE